MSYKMRIEKSCNDSRRYSTMENLDYAAAQFLLGLSYWHGAGIEENEKEAVKHFKEAAIHGNAEAQNFLGDCYKYGKGVEQNDEEAAKWYKKALDHGRFVEDKNEVHKFNKHINEYYENNECDEYGDGPSEEELQEQEAEKEDFDNDPAFNPYAEYRNW